MQEPTNNQELTLEQQAAHQKLIEDAVHLLNKAKETIASSKDYCINQLIVNEQYINDLKIKLPEEDLINLKLFIKEINFEITQKINGFEVTDAEIETLKAGITKRGATFNITEDEFVFIKIIERFATTAAQTLALSHTAKNELIKILILSNQNN